MHNVSTPPPPDMGQATLNAYRADPEAMVIVAGLTATGMACHVTRPQPLLLVHAARSLLEQAKDLLEDNPEEADAAGAILLDEVADALTILPDPLRDDAGEEG